MIQNQDHFFAEFVPLHKFVEDAVVWRLTYSWNDKRYKVESLFSKF